jgi:hypothetical protein
VIAQAFFEAVRASEGNLKALAVLIELEATLGENHGPPRESNLDRQLDKWGKALADVGALEIERLKKQIKTAVLSDAWRTDT